MKLRLSLFALGDVLRLHDEVRRLALLVEHARRADRGPDDVSLSMYVTLLSRASDQLAFQHLIHVGEISAEIVRMREGLKAQLEQFLLRVAEQLAERAIGAQITTVRGQQGHADGGIIERATKMRFALAQRLTDDALIF